MWRKRSSPGKSLHPVGMWLEQLPWEGASSGFWRSDESWVCAHVRARTQSWGDSAVAPLQVPMCSQTPAPSLPLLPWNCGEKRGTKPQVLLGPVLHTHEKGINYLCEHTGTLIGKPTLLSWRNRLENGGAEGEKKRRKNEVKWKQIDREEKKKKEGKEAGWPNLRRIWAIRMTDYISWDAHTWLWWRVYLCSCTWIPGSHHHLGFYQF